jgi:Predicted O-methyltransferase
MMVIVSLNVNNQRFVTPSLLLARCEFRGGVEEYCKAAASVLKNDGLFVVCENWLNNDRVYSGAKSSGLKVKMVYPIKGKRGRKECLFGVYVLEIDHGDQRDDDCVVKEPLAVRTECGKWTVEYAELLEGMSIPAKCNSA